MDKEVKTKWVEALRSGNYKQGKHELQNGDNTFCCLGVLCDVIDNSRWNKSGNGTIYYSGSSQMPPENILQLADIDNNICGQLIDMNDGGMTNKSQKSFSEIAQYIQYNL